MKVSQPDYKGYTQNGKVHVNENVKNVSWRSFNGRLKLFTAGYIVELSHAEIRHLNKIINE